jgi:adenosylhomocysteinase
VNLSRESVDKNSATGRLIFQCRRRLRSNLENSSHSAAWCCGVFPRAADDRSRVKRSLQFAMGAVATVRAERQAKDGSVQKESTMSEALPIDQSLLERGRERVEWIRSRMNLLAGVRSTFEESKPFEGRTIGVSLHIEPKTVVLLETLAAGGARIVGTGNYGSTQDDMVAVLQAQGMEIFGRRDVTHDEHLRNVDDVLRARPDILLDNGADLNAAAVRLGLETGIRGATEETTSGGDRLRRDYRGKVPFPVIVINDSPLKQIVENKHAVGQGAVESLMRTTNLIINGRRFVVVGYGWCGRGIAQYLKAFGGLVGVVEIDPIKALEAVMDGCMVGPLNKLAPWGQFFITATARERVVGAEALDLIADGAVLCNCGHFDTEIDVTALRGHAVSSRRLGDTIEQFQMPDGRSLTLLSEGRMVNLAGAEPKGNSIESMDLGFMLQALSLERVVTAPATLDRGPQAVPADINDTIARRMLVSMGASY